MIKVGDRVRIDRDEKLYPSKGTWPRFRGKTGTVVEINTDRERPHLTEYGVVFRSAPSGEWRKWWNGGETVWFKLYELSPLASQRLLYGADSSTPTAYPRKALAHV